MEVKRMKMKFIEVSRFKCASGIRFKFELNDLSAEEMGNIQSMKGDVVGSTDSTVINWETGKMLLMINLHDK